MVVSSAGTWATLDLRACEVELSPRRCARFHKKSLLLCGRVASFPKSDLHLVVLVHDFGAGRKSLIFGVWAAPAAGKTNPEGGGHRPPPFGILFGPPGPPTPPNPPTLWFCRHGFLAGRKSPIFEVWAARAAQTTIPKGGGRRPPLLELLFGLPGPPTPPTSAISGRPKNHISKTRVYQHTYLRLVTHFKF